MVRLNKTRMNYLETFQEMIAAYNAGSANVESFFDRLVDLARSLNEEEARGVAEHLSEEELAVFDLLTKPEMALTEQEQVAVKKVARELLAKLKTERLVVEWRRKQQARAAVRVCIEQELDRLPDAYTKDLYDRKCEQVYQHVFETYFGEGRSVYAAVG
jgi:type I restriction enzyme R subunit